MIVSIETPAFKGTRLQRCIDSVLSQSSSNWTYSLLWDGGDDESRRILEELESRKLPNVFVHFGENRGIARARNFLSEHSKGDFILPLDDDDALPFHAVERFLAIAEDRPWAAVIRARREIIDLEGNVLDTPAWFPFEARRYQAGMVTDVFNHSQPYLIRRSAYDRTSGWEGFEDFSYAGEDCDIYLKLEEQGTIELIDEVLYYYRVHDARASLVLTDEAAFEMWRRLADKTVERIGLPLRRTNEKQLFEFEPQPRTPLQLDAVDFVVASAGAGSAAETGLREAGVAGDAVHVIAHGDSSAFNAVWRKSSRPAVALVDGTLRVGDRAALEGVLEQMNEHTIDLASPPLVDSDGTVVYAQPRFGKDRVTEVGTLGDGSVRPAPWLCEKFFVARRETLAAVGGLDEGYKRERAVVVDFSLRARQRAFHCAALGGRRIINNHAVEGPAPADVQRIERKWAVYRELFQR